MSTIGSESWLDATETEPGSDLHTRATQFVATVRWDALLFIASQKRGMSCELTEKFSLGHLNLVRRIVFEDGASWIVRLRLPELPSLFGSREALNAQDCMRIEIATMRYLRRLFQYIHGTTAAELARARGCKPGVYGLPDQDQRFWQQMADIQVELASLTFDKIGSLDYDEDQDLFTIRPEIETGEGPWDTPGQYYAAITSHRMQVAEHDADPGVIKSELFAAVPRKFLEPIKVYQSRDCGPYGLANRDFGAHNILVDADFSIVGLIDFDGVLAAPAEVVAQMPQFMELDRPIPGHVETNDLALKRLTRVVALVTRYAALVRAAIAKREAFTGLNDLLETDAASVVQGMNGYAMLQGFVSDRWMAAYDWLLLKQIPMEGQSGG